MAFPIKRGDRRPYLPVQFFQKDGVTPLDISAAESVYIIVSPLAATSEQSPQFRSACVVTDGVNGLAEYRWAQGDTDTPGSYKYELEIVWSIATQDVQTLPIDNYFSLEIYDDLDTPN